MTDTRIVYDELNGAHINAEWIDDEGDRWRYRGPFWEWLTQNGWVPGTPDPCFAPYVEQKCPSDQRDMRGVRS